MIAEAIDRIAEMTRLTDRIEWAPDYQQTGRYFVWQADGTFTERFEARAPRTTRHYSTDSLARNVKSDLEHMEFGGEAAAYWNDALLTTIVKAFDPNGVYALKWKHEMVLEKHPAFTAVAELTRTRSFTQKELVRFLRAELNGHVDDSVIEQFRALKLATDGATESVVAKGREAIDRRLQQQLRQATGTDIPDEITVTIPVHDLDEAREQVQSVTILVDATTNDDGTVLLELTTVLNSLRAAERAALESVVANLRAALPEGVPIYHAFVS